MPLDLLLGNIDTMFMSWDMVLILLLQEGVAKDSGKQKDKGKYKPLEHIQEAIFQEENATK